MMKHHFVRSKLIVQENPNEKVLLRIQRNEISTCSIRNLSRPPDGQLKNVSF